MTIQRPGTFNGCTVLIVEDEYLLADELDMILSDLGATIVGPAGSIDIARQLVEAHSDIDCAMLDINVQGETVFPVARMLADRGVPFMFTTGYDRAVIPTEFEGVTCCQKPVPVQRIVRTLGRLKFEG